MVDSRLCPTAPRGSKKASRGKGEMTDFMKLVAEMRAAQKEYFKYRTKDLLQASKELERQVDAALKELAAGRKEEQGSLL